MSEKLQAKIEQNQKDQDKLAEEGRRLKKELDKPSLRNGDLAETSSCGEPRIMLKKDDKLCGYDCNGLCCGFDSSTTYRKAGSNIFDDLKRNSEDLKEFEVDGLSIGLGTQCGKSMVFLSSENKNRTFTIKEATEIYQKFGQMLATVRRSNG